MVNNRKASALVLLGLCLLANACFASASNTSPASISGMASSEKTPFISLVMFVYVEGRSMESTLHDGNILFATAYLDFLFGEPERFDVVICRYPGRGNTNFVKRIVGIPGDTVAMREGILYVNGEAVDEPNIVYPANYTLAETAVLPGHYFVLGDNRANSHDSHMADVGQLARGQLIGKARFILWPFSQWGALE